jgi:hypothetical protein
MVSSCDVGKGKAVPLQAWSGPEGSGKLRFPDYMTTAQDGGKVVNLMNYYLHDQHLRNRLGHTVHIQDEMRVNLKEEVKFVFFFKL